jgi:hypothetical protein
MKVFFVLLLMSINVFVNGQIKYGIHGGFNFPWISSGLTNVRDLPVDKGGLNFVLGVSGSYELLKDIEIESGINLNSKGYTYETTDGLGVPYDFFNKISTVSIPVTALYYLVGNDDYGERMEDFRLGLGAGLYAGYALSAKITDEDNNTVAGAFSNTNRLDYGGRIMIKTLFGHFVGFVSGEFGFRNLIKDNSAVLKQNTLMLGVGYQF